MADETEDTASAADGTPATAVAAAPQTPDELATLKSRNSGLISKVTELERQLAEERAGRTAAEQAAAGKAGTDDVLNQRIAALTAELEAGKLAAALAQKGAKYPEAFSELGDDIANMSTEKLAALEARLTSAKDDGEVDPAKPIGNNPAKGGNGPKSYDDMTSAELQGEFKKLSRADMGLEPR